MVVEQFSREEILLIEGREEGKAEERERMILWMYQKGMNISDIENIMEMPASEIKKLLNIPK